MSKLPSNISNRWVKKPIGDLADKTVRWSFSGGPFGSNLKASDYTESGVRIIQLQNIGEGVFNDDYKIYTSEAKADDLIANNIYPGEIIFSKMGDPVARACIVPAGASRYVMASDGIRFKPDINKADVYFLLNYINSAVFRKVAESVSSGSTRMRIGLDELRMLEIPLPSLAEQRKIAEILRTWDEAIETAEAELKAKQERKRWLIEKLLTPPAEVVRTVRKITNDALSRWAMKPIGELADTGVRWSFSGGPFGSNLKASDYTESGVRIIQLQNIGEGVFNDDYKIFTSEAKADELVANNIYPGEIIFSKMGDPVARACIVPAGASRYVMASDGIRFKPDTNKADLYFLLNYINSGAFRKAAESVSSGSTRMRIGLDELRMLKISIPPLPEQRKISEILQSADSDIEIINNRIETIRTQKRGLMQKLLTGEIRVAA